MNKILTQKELSRRLIGLYILALSAVALFSIVSQVLIQYAIAQQQNDARVINIAGRQRMLSQRLCKTAILLVHKQVFLPDAELYYQDISEIIQLWEKCHVGLKSGLLKLDTDIPVNNSATIDSMFQKLDPVFVTIIQNARIINTQLDNPGNDKIQTEQYALQKMLSNERVFLKLMDGIVFQYDKEAKARVQELKKIEFIIFGITILILIVEGFFIFRPIHNQVNETIAQLSDSEQNQKRLVEQLLVTNETLMQTRNELVRASEDKFRLQRKEDKVRSVAVIEGQEDERKRLALELHDGIGQMLTGLKLLAEKLHSNTFASEKDQKTFNDLKQLINDTIHETRTISFNLMPSVLNDFGIVSAIKLLAEQIEKNAVVQIRFSHNLHEATLPKTVETTLYRIVQEAITNIVKHAEATEIEIQLLKEAREVQMRIQDNGKGFDLRKLRNKTLKNGINNMRSRSEINDGSFRISSALGKGTRILVKLPLIST